MFAELPHTGPVIAVAVDVLTGVGPVAPVAPVAPVLPPCLCCPLLRLDPLGQSKKHTTGPGPRSLRPIKARGSCVEIEVPVNAGSACWCTRSIPSVLPFVPLVPAAPVDPVAPVAPAAPTNEVQLPGHAPSMSAWGTWLPRSRTFQGKQPPTPMGSGGRFRTSYQRHPTVRNARTNPASTAFW